VLIGVSGKAGTFDAGVLKAMAALNQRPIVFALSNPTANSECTAGEAYRHTEGRALFASGSPFDPVTLDGKQYTPGQANNAYVFPGIALGIIASRATRVPNEMFAVAARTLAQQVSKSDLERGLLFPPLSDIRTVSATIAAAVAEVAFDQSLTSIARPRDIDALVRTSIYQPEYQSYV
jgi:malate dehydrogenase (oxaloacetate-decarboxylating)(NADP+)